MFQIGSPAVFGFVFFGLEGFEAHCLLSAAIECYWQRVRRTKGGERLKNSSFEDEKREVRTRKMKVCAFWI